MSAVTAPEALWSGFANFYSIWQVCIAQISPFFIAYMAGLYLTGENERPHPSGRLVLVPALLFLPGFAISFAFISSTANPLSDFLFEYISILRIFAGVYFILVGGIFIVFPSVMLLKKWNAPGLRYGLTFLLGVFFAVVYMPCISPELSKIFSLSLRQATAARGAWLAFLYSTGMAMAFILTGFVIVLGLHLLKITPRYRRIAGIVCGVMVALLGFMNITGFMVLYKAFLLELFTS